MTKCHMLLCFATVGAAVAYAASGRVWGAQPLMPAVTPAATGVSPSPQAGRVKYPQNDYTPDDTEHYAPAIAAADNAIRVNFSSIDTAGAPYVKKIDIFTSTWGMGSSRGILPGVRQYLPVLAELKPESSRTDFFMGLGGSIGYPIGDAANDNGTSLADYQVVDSVSRELAKNGIKPYFAYFASPVYTGGGVTGGAWKHAPDSAKWEELCHNIAAHFKASGIRLSGHEIWNEPDCGTAFYDGTWQQYIQTYISGVKGIRSADPDALVGGLSLAWSMKSIDNGNIKAFFDRTRAAGAPVDFFSWHYYGRKGSIDSNLAKIDQFDSYLLPVRKFLNAEPALANLQQHVNEFNIDLGTDPALHRFEAVPHTFYAINRLVNATDLTRIFWCCGFAAKESGEMLLINSSTGKRYPQFYALWAYARLPVDRVVTSSRVSGIGTMAGCDGHRAGLILYNASAADQPVKALLDRLPFKKADVTIYALDDGHPPESVSDVPFVDRHEEGVSTSGLSYDLAVPAHGAVYVEISDGTGLSDTDVPRSAGTLVRKDYWYPQRGDNCAFADVNERSLVATSWSGSVADNQGGAVALTIDDATSLKMPVNATVSGAPHKRGIDSQLGIRIDYATRDGYTRSIFHALNGIDGEKAMPLGKKSVQDATVILKAGDSTIDLAAEAPPGWTGRILVCFVANNCGRQVTARYIVGKPAE